MAIPTIPLNATSDEIIIAFLHEMPFLVPAMVFFFSVVLVLIGYSFEERRTGQGNIKAWLTIVSFIATVILGVLYIYAGIVDLISLIFSTMLTIGFTLWYFITE